MKCVWFPLPLLLLALLAAAAGDPAADVANGLRATARAFEQHDMKTLEKIWSHGDHVTVFENGYANYGWADYRDHHLRPEVEEMKNVKYELSDIRARVSGKTAWATFKYTIRAEYQGQTVDGAGLGTAVVEKARDGWKIVHWHTSAPRKKPAEAAKPK